MSRYLLFDARGSVRRFDEDQASGSNGLLRWTNDCGYLFAIPVDMERTQPGGKVVFARDDANITDWIQNALNGYTLRLSRNGRLYVEGRDGLPPELAEIFGRYPRMGANDGILATVVSETGHPWIISPDKVAEKLVEALRSDRRAYDDWKRGRDDEAENWAEEEARADAEAEQRWSDSGMNAVDYIRSRIDEGAPGFDLDREHQRMLEHDRAQGRFSVASTLKTGDPSVAEYQDSHGNKRILQAVIGNEKYGRTKFARKHCVDFGTATTGGFTLDEIERYEHDILTNGVKHFDKTSGRRTISWKSPDGVTFTIGTFTIGKGRNEQEIINTVHTDRNAKETKRLIDKISAAKMLLQTQGLRHQSSATPAGTTEALKSSSEPTLGIVPKSDGAGKGAAKFSKIPKGFRIVHAENVWYNGHMKSSGITVGVSVGLLLAAFFYSGCQSWHSSAWRFSNGATLFRLDDLARDGFSPTNGPARTATVEVGRSISFVLEENATTGYRWCLAEPGNGGRGFVTLDHQGAPKGADGKARCGASGCVTVTVKPPRSGDYRILLAYRRAWERKPPIATVEVKVRAVFREDVDGADEVKEKWGGATLEEALASCRLMAENGDEDAKFDMGRYNEEGIGMPKCRDEAIRWYGRILPWSSPRRDGFIEEVTRRQARLLGIRIPFDPKTADGCVIRDFLAAETNEVVGTCLVRLLTEQIRGRRLTLTNLIVRTSNLQNDGALGMKLDMPESGIHWNSHRTVYARFCGDDIRMASHLDENDRIDEFTGTVVDKGRSMANLQFEDVSFRTSDPSIDAPVPPFDADGITGDELVEFIRRQPRPFRRWQLDEIRERLAGRRLEFHDFRFGSGMTLAIRPGEYCTFSAVPKWVPFGSCDGSMECRFCLIPSNREQERKLRRLYGGGFGNGIASLSGVVRKNVDSGASIRLQLEDVDFVMDGAIPIPGRSADGLLDGDEIVRELKYSPNGIGAETFCAAVTGQTIRFSSAIVDRYYPVLTNRTCAVVFCRVTPKLKFSAGSRDGWYVKFKIPTEREASLRRALVPGDLLVGLTGRIKGHALGTLRLEDVTFDVKWQKDAMEPQDFAKATGDDLLRVLALCRPDMREDAFHRVVRGLDGRRVTFSRGGVESAETDAQGNVACRVALGCDLFDSIVNVETTFAKGKGVDAIRKGARLDHLSGVLSDELTGQEPPNNSRLRFILRDARLGKCEDP